jgi:hypothetical protein
MSACTTAVLSVAADVCGLFHQGRGQRPAPGRCRCATSLDRSDAVHSASRSADSATNRREAADFEVPSRAMTGRSPSGSRTARLSLRVDTLMSSGSWPSGQASPRALPPSRSAAQLHGRRAPAGDARQPCHHGSRSFPWSCPSIINATYAAAMTPAGELLCVLAQHLLDGSDPGCQTDALERHILPSHLEAGHERERWIIVVMALLSLRIRHPEPSGSRRATPPCLFQQRPGNPRRRCSSISKTDYQWVLVSDLFLCMSTQACGGDSW